MLRPSVGGTIKLKFSIACKLGPDGVADGTFQCWDVAGLQASRQLGARDDTLRARHIKARIESKTT